MSDQQKTKKAASEIQTPESVLDAEQPTFMSGPVEISLNKPIMAHGDEIKVLKFREPVAGDILMYGNPIQLDFTGNTVRVIFDETKMTNMMAGLAAIPPSSIGTMHPSDWMTAAYKLANFFAPDLAKLL